MAQISVVPGTGSRRRYYPKYKIALGPFTGGLNTVSDPKLLAENELQECINYVIKPNGSLVSRPPVRTSNPIDNTADFASLLNDDTVLATPYVGQYHSATNTAKFWKFMNFSNWPAAFAPIVGINGYPVTLLSYNSKWYLMTREDLYTATADNAAFSVVGAYPRTAGGNPSNNVAAFIIKERLFVVNNLGVFWSKATDPTIWAAPDGGFVKFPVTGPSIAGASFNNTTRDTFVFNETLYVCRSDGLYKLAFTSDPAVDGTFVKVLNDFIINALVTKGEIYLLTYTGVYKYINGFLSSISQKINTTYLNDLATILNQFGTCSWLWRVSKYLLVGPFTNQNGNIRYPYRYGENGATAAGGNFYYVYDTELSIWTTWLFSPDLVNGVSGPLDGHPISVAGYKPYSYNNIYSFWVGYTANGGMAVYYMKFTDISKRGLPASENNTSSDTVAGALVGQRFTTAEIDLGDSNLWKRIYRTVVDAVYTIANHAQGSSQVGLNIDRVNRSINPADSGALSIGKSYRGKSFSFTYDGITGLQVASGAIRAAEMDDINRIQFMVSLGQPIAT